MGKPGFNYDPETSIFTISVETDMDTAMRLVTVVRRALNSEDDDGGVQGGSDFVREFLAERPGATPGEIHEAAEAAGVKTTGSTLHYMVKRGELRREGEDRSRYRYYVNERGDNGKEDG